ncbi:MAG: hypothetical protein RL141_620 [Candidatus Parcubacteria bacterium]|jgi:ABC-type glycerol-3-phosphate transport system substrate-binding protein
MFSFKRFLILALVLVFVGQGCTKGPSPQARALSQRVIIAVWGVGDDIDAYQSLFDQFRKGHPYVEIQFKRFRLEEYEEALLNAFAEDRGPDVYLIHNTWTDKYLPKITPAPPTVTHALQVASGGGVGGQSVTIEVQTVRTPSPRAVRDEFPEVVAKDVIREVDVSTTPDQRVMEERVLGLPSSIDTLALYYNKGLLNAAGIPTPPETWDEFQAQVKRLVRYGQDGAILRAGAGLGLGMNVERAADIIAVLMMQNRTEMTNEDGDPTFTQVPRTAQGGRVEAPGLQALRFYSDFANPAKEVYTWNAEQPNSLEAFMQGTSAFFVGYQYHLPLIRARAPRLNMGIAPLPQIAGNEEVNFANYWNWTVAKKTKSPDLSWLLVNEMTSRENVKTYLDYAKHPAARKALLSDQYEDEEIGVFATQVLTARSWFRGVDPRAAERALIEMLEKAPAAESADKLMEYLRQAQEKVEQAIY